MAALRVALAADYSCNSKRCDFGGDTFMVFFFFQLHIQKVYQVWCVMGGRMKWNGEM
jgi:hypothetical protein